MNLVSFKGSDTWNQTLQGRSWSEDGSEHCRALGGSRGWAQPKQGLEEQQRSWQLQGICGKAVHEPFLSLLVTAQHTHALLVITWVSVPAWVLSDPPQAQPNQPVLHKIMRSPLEQGDLKSHESFSFSGWIFRLFSPSCSLSSTARSAELCSDISGQVHISAEELRLLGKHEVLQDS